MPCRLGRTLHFHSRKVPFCDFLSTVFLIEQILQRVGWGSELMYNHCVLAPISSSQWGKLRLQEEEHLALGSVWLCSSPFQRLT